MPAEITDDGLVTQTLGERTAEIEARFRSEFQPVAGEALDLSPDSYTGREIKILATEFLYADALLADLVTTLDPSQAQGVWVDFHLALQGTQRQPATRSTIAALAYGLPGTAIGDKRVLYLPTGTTWRTPVGAVIPANGVAELTLSAQDTGPTQAVETDTSAWSIVDVVTNWTAVESTADAVPGTLVESDAAGRARVIASASSLLSGTLPAIVRALRAVPGVVNATVWNNRTLVPDANGVPAKSIEAVIDGGEDEDVATAIANSYNGTAGFAGTTTYDLNLEIELADGTTTSVTKTVKWSRVEHIDLVYDVQVTVLDSDLLPSDVLSVIQNAIGDWTNSLDAGIDVYPEAAAAEVWAALPSGSVSDVVVELSVKGTPYAAIPVPIAIRQRAQTNPAEQAAAITGTQVETFNMATTYTLDVSVDGGVIQTIGFAVSGFLIISQATALEVAAEINRQIVGATAGADEGAVTLQSDTAGAASSLQILATSSAALLAILGLSVGTTTGSDGDVTVTLT